MRGTDRIAGRPVCALFSGDTIVERDCWGDPALARACVDLTPRLRRTAEILLAGLVPSRAHR